MLQERRNVRQVLGRTWQPVTEGLARSLEDQLEGRPVVSSPSPKDDTSAEYHPLHHLRWSRSARRLVTRFRVIVVCHATLRGRYLAGPQAVVRAWGPRPPVARHGLAKARRDPRTASRPRAPVRVQAKLERQLLRPNRPAVERVGVGRSGQP